ncbi:MAG: type II secretion system F family protein [Actinomycetes bacterium]
MTATQQRPSSTDDAGTTGKKSRFKYVAQTLDGESVKGEIEAASANAARNELAVRGIRVTTITEKKGLQTDITKTKVPLVEIMHFCRQMSTFVRSGVPITEAIETIRRDTKNKRFNAVLADINERVAAGYTLAEGVSRNAEVFPAYFVAMLSSAELTGKVDEAFSQLYLYIRRDIELRRAVRKALIYPTILLTVALGVTLLITIFVIPRFADFFKSFGATLPLPTRMLMAVADFVGSPAGVITGIVAVALFVVAVVYFGGPGRKALHGFLLRAPAIGTVMTYAATERFTRVLAVLLEAGVPLPEALPNAIDCSNNLVFKERLTAATEAVLAGNGFAEPVAQTELFPTTVVQMIRVGERTGALTEQLDNVATFFETELDYAVEKMTTWFEPIVILFIGLVVGFVALAMVSAMYGIYNQVQM